MCVYMSAMLLLGLQHWLEAVCDAPVRLTTLAMKHFDAHNMGHVARVNASSSASMPEPATGGARSVYPLQMQKLAFQLYHQCAAHQYVNMPQKLTLSIRGSIVTVKPKVGFEAPLVQGTQDMMPEPEPICAAVLVPNPDAGAGAICAAVTKPPTLDTKDPDESDSSKSAKSTPKPDRDLDGDSLKPGDSQRLQLQCSQSATSVTSPTPTLGPSDSVSGLEVMSVASPCRVPHSDSSSVDRPTAGIRRMVGHIDHQKLHEDLSVLSQPPVTPQAKRARPSPSETTGSPKPKRISIRSSVLEPKQDVDISEAPTVPGSPPQDAQPIDNIDLVSDSDDEATHAKSGLSMLMSEYKDSQLMGSSDWDEE